MRRKVISSASLLSLVLSTILSLAAIYSGIDIANADSVIATIPVGNRPVGVAFDSSNSNLYVSNDFDNTVSVISGQTNAVVGNPIAVGHGPEGIAFDSENGNLYVANINDNTVSVVSGQTNRIIGNPIAVGLHPDGVAFDSANGKLYVTNQDNTVSVISGQTNQVIGNPIFVGQVPFAIAYDSANGNLYVTNGLDNTVSVISTSATPPVPPDTTITSAVEGNGAAIQNGSSTLSTSIQITFTGTSNVGIAGFECSLDGRAFSPCSSPTTLTNLAAGKHTFQVRAVDTADNRDPNPASFIWTIAIITPPTKTTITSAVDGNNAQIQNGGTSTSSSIKITFTAMQGTNPIAGFQCSLDNSPFSSCSSPTVLNNLVIGQHKFIVVAVDNVGDRDPNPSSFSWTIFTPTPAQSIQQLIQLINSMHLNSAIQAALDAQLNAILTTLSSPSNNNLPFACPRLNALTNAVVPGYLRSGQLNSDQAGQLIQSTQAIKTALHCNPTPPLQQAPIANAGPSQTVSQGSPVTLVGTGSFSPNGGTIVSYLWTQTSGTPVSLSGANTATATFTAPTAPTSLTFSLTVTDSNGAVSSPSTVTITVG